MAVEKTECRRGGRGVWSIQRAVEGTEGCIGDRVMKRGRGLKRGKRAEERDRGLKRGQRAEERTEG
jgi:hypothetical protein